jgi:hypothetical protein
MALVLSRSFVWRFHVDFYDGAAGRHSCAKINKVQQYLSLSGHLFGPYVWVMKAFLVSLQYHRYGDRIMTLLRQKLLKQRLSTRSESHLLILPK